MYNKLSDRPCRPLHLHCLASAPSLTSFIYGCTKGPAPSTSAYPAAGGSLSVSDIAPSTPCSLPPPSTHILCAKFSASASPTYKQSSHTIRLLCLIVTPHEANGAPVAPIVPVARQPAQARLRPTYRKPFEGADMLGVSRRQHARPNSFTDTASVAAGPREHER
ncbi:hypothetical protein EJ06DRAFT_394541 [Trichodelitschia bisporula]|uniref:Uncharacterized protein n=1 Tax=Trichodelitschia bisporula TaxID=703511 RepID=A0A6G1HZN6_9PEZI|nr:hypothetical protein EJ06DRAFT_394541 [Trichodelitschia bisporula]